MNQKAKHIYYKKHGLVIDVNSVESVQKSYCYDTPSECVIFKHKSKNVTKIMTTKPDKIIEEYWYVISLNYAVAREVN